MADNHELFTKLFEINETEGKLNLDKIRKHIIKCIKRLNDNYKVSQLEKTKQAVFITAVQLLMNDETKSADFTLLASKFDHDDDDDHLCDKCDWNPLHWAVVLQDKITDDAIHEIFLASPTCLIQHHNDDGEDCPGFTPVDLLVMQKHPNIPVIRYFNLHCPRLFSSAHSTEDDFPLHLAAQHSESLELLQYLLQTHFAAVRYDGNNHECCTPLSWLIDRPDFPAFDSMLQCLLDACSDIDVIGAAIYTLLSQEGISIKNRGRILRLVEILLKANPAAAQYDSAYNCETLFHAVGCLKDPICALSVMKLLLVHHPLGLEVAGSGGDRLPIHSAIENSTVEVVKFMLQVHPTSVDSSISNFGGLMHCAALNFVDAGMVPYMCSIAPQLLHEQTVNGRTPLATLCSILTYPSEPFCTLRLKYAKIITMYETDPTIVGNGATPLNELPLYFLIYHHNFSLNTPTSDYGDCFRLLLRLHPSSVDITDRVGGSLISTALGTVIDDYFIRLLLSASTDEEHKASLLEFNYRHRRSLLFLSYAALSGSPEPTIFAKMRESHREILLIVASFL